MRLPDPEPKPVLERAIMARVRACVNARDDARLWRNNVGVLIDTRGQAVRFGLAIGSADLVGVVEVCQTCPRCGHQLPAVGRFVGIEVKRPGMKPTEPQKIWADTVSSFGGYVATVTSEDEARDALEDAKR